MADKYVVSFNSDTSDSEEEEETTESESENNDVTEVSLSLPGQPFNEPVGPTDEPTTPSAEFTLDFNFDKDEDDDSTFTFNLDMTKEEEDEQPVTTSEVIISGANDLVDSSAASAETSHLDLEGDNLAENKKSNTLEESFDASGMKDLDTDNDQLVLNGDTQHNTGDLITFDGPKHSEEPEQVSTPAELSVSANKENSVPDSDDVMLNVDGPDMKLEYKEEGVNDLDLVHKEQIVNLDRETQQEMKCLDLEDKEEIVNLNLEANQEMVNMDFEANEPMVNMDLEAKEPMVNMDLEAKEPMVNMDLEAKEPMVNIDLEAKEPMVNMDLEAKEPMVNMDLEAKEPMVNMDLESKDEMVNMDLEKEPMTPSSRRRILSDEALGSPSRKSIADDDDFEARISRAKAFIESTKRGDDVSSSAASERDESDQYILGTASITTGDIQADDLYTEEDTKAVRPRKKYAFEPPNLVQKARSMDEPKRSRRRSGRDAYDPENTDELIKRIMAESRGETYIPPEEELLDDGAGYDDDDPGYGGSFSGSSHHRADDAATSLLERRIDAMKKRNAELAADNFDPRPSQARRRNSTSEQERQLVLFNPDDDTASVTSSIRRPQSARAGWRNQHQNGFDDDDDVFTESNAGALVPYVLHEEEEESDPDEDPIYKTRRALRKRLALPESAFLPQKSEDTDEIVREKTAGIRSVIAKQEDILHDLRKASQSFDEVEDEIKSIRDQFYESQERHAILQEEIEFDMENMKQRDEEQAAQAYARKYAPLPTVDYTKGYIPTKAPKALAWDQEAVSDDEESAATYDKKCLALTYNGWTGNDSQTMDSSRDVDVESTASMPAYVHRPLSAHARQPRSMYGRNKARFTLEDHDSEMNDEMSSRMSIDDEELEPRRFQPNRAPKKPDRYGINLSEVDHEMEELSAKINSWRSKMSSETATHPEENGLPGTKHEDLENLTNGIDADSSDSGAYSNGSRPNENGNGLDHPEVNGVCNGYSKEGEEQTGYSWRRNGRASSVAPETTSSSWRKDPSDWRSRLSASTQESLKKHSSVDTDSYRPKYGSYTKPSSVDNNKYISPIRSNRYTSSTLSDYEPPVRSRTRARSCEPTSGFRSRFLDKVREKKTTGDVSDKREKPFKSRFLKSAVSSEA